MADQVVLPGWMLVLQNPLPDETSGKHIGRIVRALIGISLLNHADQLAQLFLVNEKPGRAASVSGVKTNCATSMREVWCLAGCMDHFVTQEYQNGMAVTWDLQAARDESMLFGAHEAVWVIAHPTPAGDIYVEGQVFTSQADAEKHIGDNNLTDARVEKHEAWELIDEGWGLHYVSPGSNNDHMEFALAKPDLKTGMCEHAGGGRADNAITKSIGDIRFSLGRPLQHVIAPYKMAIAGGPLPLPVVEPTPDVTPVTEPDPTPELPPPGPGPGVVPIPTPTVSPQAAIIMAVIAAIATVIATIGSCGN